MCVTLTTVNFHIYFSRYLHGIATCMVELYKTYQSVTAQGSAVSPSVAEDLSPQSYCGRRCAVDVHIGP